MKRDIKSLKPRLNGRFKQGFFDTYNPIKYIGQRPIIYRSSWELMFMKYCEEKTDIVQWGSEVTSIPYSDFLGNRHTYYIDFTLQMKNGKTVLVEVKPSKDIPKTDMDIRTDKTKAQNYYKWQAAKQYAKTMPNTEFLIVTENFFGAVNSRFKK